MSIDITKAVIRKLASQGETFSMSIFRSLKATYYREALDFVQIYKKDALMNKYEIDVHEEETAVELFAKNIMIAEKFLRFTYGVTTFQLGIELIRLFQLSLKFKKCS